MQIRYLHRIKEAENNTSPDFFLDSLETCTTPQEFLKPRTISNESRRESGVDLLQRFVVTNNVVMCQNHQHSRERDTPINVS